MKADHPEDIEDIKELIAQTENEQVEFKETTGQLERGMETLCAFLNGEGGTAFFIDTSSLIPPKAGRAAGSGSYVPAWRSVPV